MLLVASAAGLAFAGEKAVTILEESKTPGEKTTGLTIPGSLSAKDKDTAQTKTVLKPYAEKVKASLSAPKDKRVEVHGTLEIAGTVGDHHNLSRKLVWVRVQLLGRTDNPLPDRMDYYLPLNDGTFGSKIRLFQGAGTYRVEVRLPGQGNDSYFYPMTTFEAVNTDSSQGRDIAYSVSGVNGGLKLEEPTTGLVSGWKELRIKGTVASSWRELLVRVKKDGQSWKKVIPVRAGRFDERIPLLYGRGIHEVQVMVPEEKQKGTFVEGATLYAENLSERVLEPISYTRLYEERGIRLISPTAGGDVAGMTMNIAGTVDPKAKFASQTTHLIVQTKKGNDQATYFLPIRNHRFDGNVWFRFGPGTYEVTLYVPEITKENRDYFRFFTVAGFRMESTVKEDMRHLLPSRGIESDHPEIRQLAASLTRGVKGNRSKAKAIYRYVAQTMSYDMDKFRNNTFAWDDSALKSLRTKSGVCQDYAFLTLALLRASGIPSRFVEGEAGDQRHAWVEAYADGRWIIMDPTWGSGYITPEGRYVKKYDERWFDPDPEEFAKTHHRTGVSY